jgi:hypothetical protein
MDRIELNKEINAFYGDIKATEDILSFEREDFARRLKNGLGDDIKDYLTNPPKPNYWNGFKIKLNRWWNNRKSGK